MITSFRTSVILGVMFSSWLYLGSLIKSFFLRPFPANFIAIASYSISLQLMIFP